MKSTTYTPSLAIGSDERKAAIKAANDKWNEGRTIPAPKKEDTDALLEAHFNALPHYVMD